MDQPIPNEDRHPELREALKRDAARLPQPPFDAALHAAVMRRVRAISKGERDAANFPSWLLPFAAGAAALVLGTLALRWQAAKPVFNSPNPTKNLPGLSDLRERPSIPPNSAWDYRRAAARSDGALVAMLDRDMCRLLPPSDPVFSRISPVVEEPTHL